MADSSDALKRAQIDLKNRLRLLDNRFGEHSPINNDMLPNMPQGSMVVITKEVKDILSLIQDKTQRDKKEVPFLLFGKNEGQVVFIDNIDAELDNLSGVEANHANLLPALEKFINKSKKDGSDIVVHGHSHPMTSEYNKSFSLGDMNAYKDFRLDNGVFRTGKIELCSCLLVDGNYNFLFFDGNDYYKFNDVFVQAENGDIIEQLPCYKKSLGLYRGNERG
ncbi:MAG: hypothetical protein J6R52_00690 [Alphaproteobacteria bacterium]|nr:hypothetical protein [Alphaproteobacteria bacterium]